MKVEATPPRGFRDLLPADVALRAEVLRAITRAYATAGFQQVETPAVESLHRLQSDSGGENEKMLFRILRRGLEEDQPVLPHDACDLGLRYDLTVPLARYYANNRAQLPTMFRSLQIGPVWRAERPQKGRFRQFVQCDIDVLGEASVLAEVELCVATLRVLGELGLTGCVLRVNDRRILTGMLAAAGVPEQLHGRVLVAVDKFDKVGAEGVAAEVRGLAGLEPAAAEAVAALVAGFGAPGSDAPMPAGAPEDAAEGIATISDAVRRLVPGAQVVFDPSLVRGMGYYTGAIFEVAHPASRSSIAGGGRYDGLIGKLGGVATPACGFSLGFERIMEIVDPDVLLPQQRVVALLHRDASPVTLGLLQQRLVTEGWTVRAVRRGRNPRRQLEELRAQGATHHASVDGDDPDRELDVRELTAD
ncbi:histidyl-tRNA synthetase [Kineococcus xinjiangensis]|uniref:Histidine--tRNA ligase n=1 Tax=Kineococcus xinjiangensis TaxID=512762 RepID=A0A2S6IV73_9ACTN|nr:histidine--tRNA ligase [Kineococcus xinjiangensis]PPK97954.1 histidyl-tRNA synthetase [Kineococcus xinjiangensis]